MKIRRSVKEYCRVRDQGRESAGLDLSSTVEKWAISRAILQEGSPRLGFGLCIDGEW